MVGDTFWATGIILHYYMGQWLAIVEFYDNGFCDLRSTQGTIQTRYWCNDIDEALTPILEDVKKLGIVFREDLTDRPALYFKGDGEHKDMPPPDNWKQILYDAAQRHGLSSAYELQEEQPMK